MQSLTLSSLIHNIIMILFSYLNTYNKRLLWRYSFVLDKKGIGQNQCHVPGFEAVTFVPNSNDFANISAHFMQYRSTSLNYVRGAKHSQL